MSTGRWKFQVEGTFCKESHPVSPCEAIIESGDRSDHSPFRFRGVGPVAKADENGRFQSWYVTEGSTAAIAKPETVFVYIRVTKGEWAPVVVSIGASNVSVLSETEVKLDPGSVAIPSGITPYVQDT